MRFECTRRGCWEGCGIPPCGGSDKWRGRTDSGGNREALFALCFCYHSLHLMQASGLSNVFLVVVHDERIREGNAFVWWVVSARIYPPPLLLIILKGQMFA